MKLGQPVKILVGLATAWFVLYPFLFFAVWLIMFLGIVFFASTASGSSAEAPFPFFILPFFAIFPLHFLTIFLYFGLIAFYLIHVIKNTTGSETVRIILGLGNFFMPFVAMPIYYYLFVWRDQPPDWARAPAPPAR